MKRTPIYLVIGFPYPFVKHRKVRNQMEFKRIRITDLPLEKQVEYSKKSFSQPHLRGIFLSKEDAINEIITNGNNLHEGYFQYMAIEKRYIGIDNFSLKQEVWFKLHKNENSDKWIYKKTRCPKCFAGTIIFV